MSLKIHLLGTPQILIDRKEASVTRRKSRALVYYLASQEAPLLREQLLSVFWADLPRATALQTLRTSLHGLRRVLGDWMVIEADRVSLAASVWVDGRDFEKRLNIFPQEPELLAQAMELYRGEFLEGFTLSGVQPFEDWLTVNREQYRRLAVRGWSALAADHENRGEFRQALDWLERALSADRLQEDLQRDAIRLLYLAGDRPGAVRRYDELRRLLDEEMGVPPMIETRRLYDDIVNDRPVARSADAAAPGKAEPALRRLTAGMRASLLPQTSPDMESSPEIPFGGRAAELEQLREITASGRLALIEGEAGVGKTRLAERCLADFTRQTGGIALIGRGRELEQSLPYLPLVEALRSMLASPKWTVVRASVLAAVPPVWLAEAARLLPELDAPQPAGSPAPAEEARLFEGIHRLLVAAAQFVPMIVLLDDLQWADASTLGVFGYLLRSLRGVPVRFLATLRPGTQRPPVSVFIQSLLRSDCVRRLQLERLSREEVAWIAEQLSPATAEPLADWLYTVSEGNAYILSELVRHARRNGWVGPEVRFNPAELPAESILPRTVFSLIQSRLAQLSENSRRVLDAGVAEGREFTFRVAAHAAGLSEAAALDGLDELRSAGLITSIGGERFRFDHPLTMEVAYQDVGDLRHRLLHHRVADALEHLYVDRLDEFAGLLAWHYVEGRDPARAARHAMKAAGQSAALAAWSEAIGFYELALAGLGGQDRFAALAALADAYERQGNFPRAAETLREALQLASVLGAAAEELQPSADRLRLALGRVLVGQARFPEVIELARRVLQSGDPAAAIQAEVLWATALSIEGADLAAAAEHLQAAHEMWHTHRIGDLASLANIQFESGSVAAQQGDLLRAVEYYRQSLSTAIQIENDLGIQELLLAYNNLAYHLFLLGDPQAEEYAVAGLALAQEKGHLAMLTFLHSTLGEIRLAAGELDSAESHFKAGLNLAEQFSVTERIAGLTANLGRLALARGDASMAIHLLSNSLGQADSLGTRHLAAQIRIWLAPLLPPTEARIHLEQARRFAANSGRSRLIEEADRAAQKMDNESSV